MQLRLGQVSTAWTGADKLTTASTPDETTWNLTGLVSVSGMFNGASILTSVPSDIPTGVTDMGYMFTSSAFNGDISNWDVSNVTDMNNMFLDASQFNQDISGWIVSNVTDMENMFRSATAFNNGDTGDNGTKPLSWGGNTSNVTDMNNMFLDASQFNQDISSWTTSSVTGMSGMFFNAAIFNNGDTGDNGTKPLSWGGNTSNVTDMTNMFRGAVFDF